jgi:hypothetical protein
MRQSWMASRKARGEATHPNEKRLASRWRALIVAAVLTFITAALAWGPCHEFMNLRRALGDGKTIWFLLYSRMGIRVGRWVPDRSMFPRSCGPEGYRTSTDFFRSYCQFLVENGERNGFFYEIFGAPSLGGVPYGGQEPARFQRSNNVWCVVADLKEVEPDRRDDHSASLPYMFTRNLGVSALAELTECTDPRMVPLGGRGIVVILRGGGVRILWGRRGIVEYFRSCGLTNTVLRP